MKNTLKLILESIRIAIDKAIDKAIKGIPQSDYNENDETSMSFIKNRPFYETQETIIFDGDIELDMIGDLGLYAFTDKLNLVAGQEYELVYNDASTKFISKENSTHFPMAGMNIFVSTDNICIEYPTTVNGHLIIRIPSTIKQIDEKYLPETDKYNDVFIVNITHNHEDGSYSADKTLAEILDAKTNGKLIVCTQRYSSDYVVIVINPAYALFSNTDINPNNHIKVESIFIYDNGTVERRVDYLYDPSCFIEHREVNTLITTDKTIVGAINEINNDIKVVLENYEQKLEEATRSIDSIGTIIDEINGEVI